MYNLFQLDAEHYYFTRTRYLNLELKERGYYFSSPMSFNDPFDCDFHHLEKYVDGLSENEVARLRDNSLRSFEKRKLEEFTKKLLKNIDEGHLDVFGIKAIQRNSARVSSAYLAEKYDDLSSVEMLEDIDEYKKALKLWLASTLNSAGVKCLTSQWFSAPMWAHYGAIHQGVCVGVYYPENMFKKWRHNVGHFNIDYVDEMNTPIEAMDLRNLIVKFMTTKYKEWEYEDESRIISFKNCGYVPFRCTSLREIILGAKWFDDLREESSFKETYSKLEFMDRFFELRRAQASKKCRLFLSYVERGSRYVNRSEVPCSRLSRVIGALNKRLDSEAAFHYILNR